jgi:hypothetical protein
MDAISESESRRDKSHQSPAKSMVPSTHAHSPDPEVPDPEPKWTNTWDVKVGDLKVRLARVDFGGEYLNTQGLIPLV